MFNLALTFDAQGQAAEAQALQRQVYEIRKRVQGAEHRDTIGCLNDLALTIHAASKASDALA
jgi:hypothetical protein